MIKRFYNLDFLEEKFHDFIDICIVGFNEEERTKYLPSLWASKFKGKSYCLTYLLKEEKYQLEEVSFSNIKPKLTQDFKDLTLNLIGDLDLLALNDKVILIDITGIKQPAFFYLLKILKENFKPKKIFLSYTEPLRYKRNEKKQNEFILTEDFLGINALPGFIRPIEKDKERVLVALIGFEGKRFSHVFQEVTPDLKKTHAIIGFPPFRPGWQYFSYSCNQSVLELSKAYLNLSRATAYEPFSIYKILEKIKKHNPDGQLTIAPIGTKPHSLGAALFAINNEDVRLIYDFPLITNNYRTEKVGQSYIYNITDILY